MSPLYHQINNKMIESEVGLMNINNRISDYIMRDLNEIFDHIEQERRINLERKVLLEQRVWYSGKTCIKINPDDNDIHNLPHYHIEGPDGNASVNILTGEIIVGVSKLRGKIQKQLKKFVSSNRELLLNIWNEINPEKTFELDEIKI